MKTSAFEHWCERLQLPISTRDFLVRLRSSPPARRVQGRLLNVSGTYASRKMGVSIQFESHTVELWAIYTICTSATSACAMDGALSPAGLQVLHHFGISLNALSQWPKTFKCASGCHSYKKGDPVFGVQQCSKRDVRIGPLIVE